MSDALERQKTVTTEIEMKFLANIPDNPIIIRKIEIVQGYVAIADQYYRIRKETYKDSHNKVISKYTLTLKSEDKMVGKVLVRTETNTPITQSLFDAYLYQTKKVIKKTRYMIPVRAEDGKTYIAELDIYGGILGKAQLAMVEVEFGNIEETKDFKAPRWFGENVTENEQYRNSQLADIVSVEEARQKLKLPIIKLVDNYSFDDEDKNKKTR
jgi:CYTH domain-containing protein